MGVNFDYTSGIATIELDDQKTKNSLNDEIVAKIITKLEEWQQDSGLRGLILCGAGGSFSSGGDLNMIKVQKENALKPGGREKIAVQMRKNARLVELLRDFPAPTIAVIDGVCAGAALGWVSACDLRIATPKTIFITGFAKLGLSTDFGTSRLLAEVVGRSTANNWLLLSPVVSAEEAATKGLLDMVVSAEETTMKATEIISAASPKAVHAIRKNLSDSNLPLAESLDNEAVRFADNL